MAPSLALFGRTYLIGIVVAAPVGAMGMLCIQRTLARDWRAGLATGAGIATADGTYAALAAFGLAAVSSAIVAWQTPLRLVGGAALIYLGARSMLAHARSACEGDSPGEGDARDSAAPDPGDGRALPALYASAVGLTLTNPMTIMAFGAVFASAGLAAQPDAASAAIATGGIFSGSLSWWIVLVTGVAIARAQVGERLVGLVSRVSGIVILGFGVYAIASVLGS